MIMKNGTTTSSRNGAISPYSSDIARILLGNIHGRADAPHPLWLCAHAVSGHVAAVHIGSFLRRGNPDPRMSLVGHSRHSCYPGMSGESPRAVIRPRTCVYESARLSKFEARLQRDDAASFCRLFATIGLSSARPVPPLRRAYRCAQARKPPPISVRNRAIGKRTVRP